MPAPIAVSSPAPSRGPTRSTSWCCRSSEPRPTAQPRTFCFITATDSVHIKVDSQRYEEYRLRFGNVSPMMNVVVCEQPHRLALSRAEIPGRGEDEVLI